MSVIRSLNGRPDREMSSLCASTGNQDGGLRTEGRRTGIRTESAGTEEPFVLAIKSYHSDPGKNKLVEDRNRFPVCICGGRALRRRGMERFAGCAVANLGAEERNQRHLRRAPLHKAGAMPRGVPTLSSAGWTACPSAAGGGAFRTIRVGMPLPGSDYAGARKGFFGERRILGKKRRGFVDHLL